MSPAIAGTPAADSNIHANSARQPVSRLTLSGPMTFDYRQELEQKIIYAMRRTTNLESDLSAVTDIDLYGVHLLGLLQSVGHVVAIAPHVEEAARRLLTSYRGATLGRVARRAEQSSAAPAH